MKLFVLYISCPINPHIIKSLLPLLSDEKQTRLFNYVDEQDKVRTMVADLLIRRSVRCLLNLRNDQIFFDKNCHGKPHLRDHPNFHFNVSHSGKWVTCVIDNNSIGIDIEEIKPIDLDIARRFFAKEEQDYVLLSNLVESQKLARFYEIWTLKESYIKAIGRGLSLPLSSFSIIINDHCGEIKLKTDMIIQKYYFYQYELDPYYKMAVCAKHRFLKGEVIFEDALDFLNSVLRNDYKDFI